MKPLIGQTHSLFQNFSGYNLMSRLAEVKKHLSWTDPSEPDEITKMLFLEWDELYDIDRAEVDRLQLEAAKERVETLMPKINALKAKADNTKFSGIKTLNDLVPLVFEHTQYKSYPMSLLENNRFDLLTRWLDGLTSIDLSGVDVSDCDSIDGWLDKLENETEVQIFHTSGTTGKLAFLPRTVMERDLWYISQIKQFDSFTTDPGNKVGFDHIRLPVISPYPRYGNYTSQRMIKFFCEHVAPSPEQVYTLTNGTLSADLISLSGRVKVAQTKGELDKLRSQLTEAQRADLKQYLEELERRPREIDAFMERMHTELRGQRVFIMSQCSYLAQTAEKALARGLKGVFSPNSLGLTGGGNKGAVMPDNWQQKIYDFTGMTEWRQSYGMTEIIPTMPSCKEGYYHVPPYLIPFLLDPDSGEPLPRTGTQTGRYACMDILARGYWGGVLSGDRVTLDWEHNCGCGRTGPRVHDDVVRYSDVVTGDDRILCSAVTDNTDAAMQSLVG